MEVLASRLLLHPADPPATLHFYREVLGLPVYREFGDGDQRGVVFFLGGGYLEVSGRRPPDRPGPTPATRLWLQVRDLRAELARLQAAGLEPVREARLEPWGLLEAWIQDPEGLPIVLVEVPADHPLRRDLRPPSGSPGAPTHDSEARQE
ncbi:VOC family protein [Aciditerrimonas ferrireducens]|uniref:VOC family protein n=1 Tax=Aciditerrimonas ferrireducens TaxID=667306 RepID=UPI0020040D55|nr:VOC family protein [Aciditerrimonas ferrireducens]MCK4176187.1 VOC family protein [Aciditerrimonas ferrireducens]